MNYKKITLFFFMIFLLLNCGKTIIKISNPASNPEKIKADYGKRYFSNWIGLQEYSRAVTPNKPQIFRSELFTTDEEKARHTKPVCTKNVDMVVIYPDIVDSIIHGLLGGITSSRSVLIYCNQ